MKKSIIPDILSGLSVSFAAISLGAAFGTLSGRGAFAGMVAAAVIPIITSIFGGTRVQASGPTAPMTAVSSLVVAFAYQNFSGDKVLAEQFITMVLLLNALFMVIAGLIKLGKFISLVPQVVILGFMNGIAVLIWIDQIKRLFGVGEGRLPLDGNLMLNIFLALSTLSMIYFIPWIIKKVNVPSSFRMFFPGILISILVMTFISVLTGIDVEKVKLGSAVSSVSEYFSLMQSYFPSKEVFSYGLLAEAVPYALQLTLLGYLDSLLTSLVIDNMTREKTNQNKELIGQGLANGASAFFMGIPGAQATIRSVLLLKEGAQTRLAGVLVGIFALMGFIVFKDLIILVPSAVFVGVLLKAGNDVFDRDFIHYYFKRRWKRSRHRNMQLGFIIYTTVITAVIDLNVAVVSGTVLFYLAKRSFKLNDAETDFSNVESELLSG